MSVLPESFLIWVDVWLFMLEVGIRSFAQKQAIVCAMRLIRVCAAHNRISGI
ncbi:MAG TPA: hypothetical protein VFI68_11930 [Anaerolineales bacterium]|nr:hypothetical protein [Anaerolineales bacterium]